MSENYYDPERSPSRCLVDMHAASDHVGSSGSAGGVVESPGGDCSHTIPSGVIYCDPDGRVEERPIFAIDFAGPIRGGEPNIFLRKGNPETKLKFEELSTIRTCYGIPQMYSMALPTGSERADWKIPGWTTMYELPLSEGARLPLPRLLLEVCNHHGIAPSQLMPNAWRVLMAAERFGEMIGVPLTYQEFLEAYHLQVIKQEKGRYILVNQLKEGRLIFDKNSSDGDWKSRYFFVPFDALGASDYPNIPHSWDSACCTDSPGSVVLLDHKEKFAKWLKFPREKRKYSAILTERNLDGSSLRDRVISIPIQSEEFQMSRRYRPPTFQGDGAMAKLRLKKSVTNSSAVAERIDEVVEVPAPSVRVPDPKRRAEEVHPDQAIGDTVNLSFPSSIVAQSDFGPYLDEAQKLVFPNDHAHFASMSIEDVAEAHFAKSFQSMQEAGFLLGEVKGLVAQVKSHKADRVSWRKEIKKAREDKLAMDKEVSDLKDAHGEELRRAIAKYEALEKQHQDLKDDVDLIAAEADVRAKGVMAGLYRHHHPDGKWDVTQYEKDVRELDEYDARRAGSSEANGLTDGHMYVDPDCDPLIDCSFDPPHESTGGHDEA